MYVCICVLIYVKKVAYFHMLYTTLHYIGSIAHSLSAAHIHLPINKFISVKRCRLSAKIFISDFMFPLSIYYYYVSLHFSSSLFIHIAHIHRWLFSACSFPSKKYEIHERKECVSVWRLVYSVFSSLFTIHIKKKKRVQGSGRMMYNRCLYGTWGRSFSAVIYS